MTTNEIDQVARQIRVKYPRLDAYRASRLLREQTNGMNRFLGTVNANPVSHVEAVYAVRRTMPELFVTT